jgi:recombination protein RecA
MAKKKIVPEDDSEMLYKQRSQQKMEIISRIQKITKVGKEAITLASNRKKDFDLISTGDRELDRILTPNIFEEKGQGGIPRGFLCEFFGPESGGKSSLCMMLAASVTKKEKDGLVLWVNAEGSWVDAWAKNHGVNTENVVLVEAGLTGEKYFEIILDAARSEQFDMIVLDSIASIQPEKLQKADLDKDARMCALASLLSRVGPQLAAAAQAGNCAIICINQIRHKMVMFGNPETTPGGNALKFFSSLRLRLSRVSAKNGLGIIKDDEEIGIRSNVVIAKSRFGPPLKESVLSIYYDSRVRPHPFDMLIDKALSYKIIKHKSKKDNEEVITLFSLPGFPSLTKIAGLDEFKVDLLDDPRAIKYIFDQIIASDQVVDPEIQIFVEQHIGELAKEDKPVIVETHNIEELEEPEVSIDDIDYQVEKT